MVLADFRLRLFGKEYTAQAGRKSPREGGLIICCLPPYFPRLWTVHKRRPQSGGWVCPVRTRGEALQMRTSALFGAKNFGFLKFIVRPHGQFQFNSNGLIAHKLKLLKDYIKQKRRAGVCEGPQ